MNMVVGTQWGDEGKGKIVDYLSKDADYVVRFQGGNNAGHTIKVKDEVYKLHIIPSGVIQGKTGVIGNGCVIDPEVLTRELSALVKKGFNPRLFISNRAHVIMPYHKLLDGAEETYLGKGKIGTTKRGIGPCYSDKVARNGVRIGDLLDEKVLMRRLEIILPVKQRLLDAYEMDVTLDREEIFERYYGYGQQIKEYVTDTHVILNDAVKKNKHVLLEGAQGAMLDIDFGTYPYTTSSHVIAGGASIGTGIGPRRIDEIIGIAKAYTTRVGEGPMPTELFDDAGKHLQEKGHEYGTTTSRPRRCGWLDLVVVKHSCLISGVTRLAITKLDVLTGLETVKICTRYSLRGTEIDVFPAGIGEVEQCKPVYKEFKGWDELQGSPRKLADLPDEAQEYLRFIEGYLRIPIAIVSVGPGREETFEI